MKALLRTGHCKTITINQALFFSLSMGLIGIFCLFSINFYSGLFGLLSLILYVLAYTPLKRISSLSVFVGAFPGAIPFMLGWIAVSNNFAIEASILFAIQFIWQFPHFWSIAWISNDDCIIKQVLKCYQVEKVNLLHLKL